MKKKDKELALQLLLDREKNLKITYDDITRQTGYSRKQLGRLAKELKEKDIESILTHGNVGKKPTTTASDQEVSYLRNLKIPYPKITIAQFRDIFIEDVIENPTKVQEVEQYGLKPRSKSWFRDLFIKEGWKSPLSKPVRIDGDRKVHTMRLPRASRGELIQIDGTEYDWFNDGRKYTLHLAVDDATTEVLAGWFMESECTRGYSNMTKLILEKHGLPKAFYCDKYSVFQSVKSKAPSQFGSIIQSLNIQMIFANSAEAKGRVERYNGTAQNRLPNDIIRFNVPHDYDVLNEWFNQFYIKYLNKKFAFPPLDPHDSFIEIPPETDYSKIFRLTYERVMRNNMFSFEKDLYNAFDENGVLFVRYAKSKITVYRDALNGELYLEYYNKKYICVKTGERKRNQAYEVENQKELQQLLEDERKNNL